MKFLHKLGVFALMVLSGVLVFSVTAFGQNSEQEAKSSGERFHDVAEGSEFYDAVEYLRQHNVVQGYDGGVFGPDNTINRAEFLKIVMEVSDFEPSGSDCFIDVTDEWFAPYICEAANLGLVKGYDDGLFRPARTINFAEASKIIVNTLAIDVDAADNEANNENWYQRYVVAMDLLAAIPMTIDNMDKEITRGEMAEMVWRVKAGVKTKASKKYSDYEVVKEKEHVEEQVVESHEDKVVEEDKVEEEKVEEHESDVESIILEAGYENGVVEWDVNGYSELGFKVVWSKHSGPTYPTRDGDKYSYLPSPSAHAESVTAFDGSGTYYVRVCEYLDGKCGVYSNEIEVVFAEEEEVVDDNVEEETVVEDDDNSDLASDGEPIHLTAGDAGKVTWVAEGWSDLGFKVVWSKDSEPTYPTRDGDHYAYLSSPEANSYRIETDEDGTYYVRVCEYLGGTCGTYSNEVMIEM